MLVWLWMVAWASEAVVVAERVFEAPPHAQCHASTVAWTPSGLVVAWFGGTSEGDPDVGIWLSRWRDGAFSSPVEVARDAQHAAWNPVLFRRATGELDLYYKVGASPWTWKGWVATSTDDGQSWSDGSLLPEPLLGPIKNKPVVVGEDVVLSGSSTEDDGWRVHIERSDDGGNTWARGEPLNDGRVLGAIQPTLLVHPGGRVQLLARSRQGRIASSWSKDGGRTWGPMGLTGLPNPNAAVDGLALADGRLLLVHNPTSEGRNRLVVSLSDDGVRWREVVVLEEAAKGEFSYPAVIQAPDGRVHVTYTHLRRHIQHVVLDPKRFEGSEASTSDDASGP